LQKEIIPERAFSCRGMHFAEGNHPWRNFSCRGMIIAEGNHPCRNFSPQRDAFRGRKSSLEELFSSEGCILQKGIILGRAFSCRGMIIAEGNHPWRNFSPQRDAFRGRKSSLPDLFSAEGCILQKEIIPGGVFFC